MNQVTKIAAIFGIVGIVAASAVSSAAADTPSSTVSGGALSVSTSAPALSAVTLTGANQVATGTASTWTIIDARGTGAGWSVSLSATDFTSAAGASETTVRTIPVANNLTITPGTLTAGTGSDTAPTASAVTVTAASTPQALITSGIAKGTYTLAPSFSMNIPANAYRSNNKVGSTNTGGANAFTSTITYTIQ